jgi:hypothetical protein
MRKQTGGGRQHFLSHQAHPRSSSPDPAFDAIDTVYGMGYRWQA